MPGHLQFRAFLYLMCLLYCAFHAKCICPDPLQMPRACHCFWKWLKTSQNPHVLLTFDKVQNPLCLPGETTSERPKVVRTSCPSHHNDLHFFDMSTSIHLPEVARSWCALRILTWKCASGHNACTFSTSQLPKMVRSWWVLYVLTLKCASRHNGVHFFDMSTSKSGPNLVCFVHFVFEMCFAPQRRAIFHLSSGQLAPFSKPTFQPSGATNH